MAKKIPSSLRILSGRGLVQKHRIVNIHHTARAPRPASCASTEKLPHPPRPPPGDIDIGLPPLVLPPVLPLSPPPPPWLLSGEAQSRGEVPRKSRYRAPGPG